MIKKPNLYCENCNKKYQGVDTSNLIQIIKSQIQKSFKIAIDQETIKQEAFENQKESFKCPKCGYLMRSIKGEK